MHVHAWVCAWVCLRVCSVPGAVVPLDRQADVFGRPALPGWVWNGSLETITQLLWWQSNSYHYYTAWGGSTIVRERERARRGGGERKKKKLEFKNEHFRVNSPPAFSTLLTAMLLFPCSVGSNPAILNTTNICNILLSCSPSSSVSQSTQPLHHPSCILLNLWSFLPPFLSSISPFPHPMLNFSHPDLLHSEF